MRYAPLRMPIKDGRDARPWEGPFAIKPWDFRVAVAIPVIDTYEEVAVCVELLRLQTLRPFIMLIDTGSSKKAYRKIESMRAEDLEVHRLVFNGVLHPCDFPAIAMDFAMSACRSPYLFCTHADVFAMRNDLVEHLVKLCKKHKAVGYHITKKRYHDDVEGMVGHSCLMLDMATMDRIYAAWSQRRLCTLFDLPDHRPNSERKWFPDTELLINYMMREAELQPHLIGEEELSLRQVDENIDHFRGLTTHMLYHPDVYERLTEESLDARQKARRRIKEWKRIERPTPTLSVITCVGRPQLLPQVEASLPAFEPYFDLEWVRVQGENTCGWKKSKGMEDAKGEWLWWLDDDNLAHPDFGKVLRHYIDQYPDANMFIFNQTFKNKLRLVASPKNVCWQKIDQAQWVVRKSAVGDIRYPDTNDCDDWDFMQAIWPNLKDSTVFVQSDLVYYNKLDEGGLLEFDKGVRRVRNSKA